MLTALLPWISQLDVDNEQKLMAACRPFLTILRAANLEQVTLACQQHAFTHIHILAHGQEYEVGFGSAFGIALHDVIDPTKSDVVSGSRFAAAICAISEHRPAAVVTVASCDSGAVNSVIHAAGASFAHDLHQAGIPFVLASQFPLTFGGSVTLVEGFYGEILWGKDPITAVHRLRNRLFTLRAQFNHDWASIIVYESLPADMNDQLEFTQYKQTKAAIDQVLSRLDEELKSSNKPISQQAIDARFTQVETYFNDFPQGRAYLSESLGLKGSAYKRKSEMVFKIRQLKNEQSEENVSSEDPSLTDSVNILKTACFHYKRATENQLRSEGERATLSSLHWLITQQLVLQFVLKQPFSPGLWYMAEVSAQTDLDHCLSPLWAHGSLLELYLLRVLIPIDNELSIPSAAKADLMQKCLFHAEQFSKLAAKSLDDFPLASTRRQLLRYLDWWLHRDFTPAVLGQEQRKEAVALVSQLLEVF